MDKSLLDNPLALLLGLGEDLFALFPGALPYRFRHLLRFFRRRLYPRPGFRLDRGHPRLIVGLYLIYFGLSIINILKLRNDALAAVDIDDLLAQAGYPKEEREFSAHLTLCRVNHPMAGIKMGEAIAQFSHLKLGSIAADAIYIYQSQLTPAGPNYTLLGDFKLR